MAGRNRRDGTASTGPTWRARRMANSAWLNADRPRSDTALLSAGRRRRNIRTVHNVGGSATSQTSTLRAVNPEMNTTILSVTVPIMAIAALGLAVGVPADSARPDPWRAGDAGADETEDPRGVGARGLGHGLPDEAEGGGRLTGPRRSRGPTASPSSSSNGVQPVVNRVRNSNRARGPGCKLRPPPYQP